MKFAFHTLFFSYENFHIQIRFLSLIILSKMLLLYKRSEATSVSVVDLNLPKDIK